MEEKGMPKIVVAMLGFIVFVLSVVILYLLRSVCIPLAIALLLSFVGQPVLGFLRRKLKLPTSVGILLYIGLLLVVIFLGGLIFSSSINAFVQKSDEYRASYSRLYDKYSEELKDFFNIPEEDPFNLPDLIEKAFPADENSSGELQEGAPSLESTLFSRFDWFSILKPLLSFSGNFVNFMGKLVLVMIFLMFILAESASFNQKLLKIFPGESGGRIRELVKGVNTQVVRYLNVKVLVSLLTGILVFFACLFIGLDFAFMWAVIAFILNFIPSIGSIIFFFLPTLMAVVQFLPDEQWGSITAVVVSIGLIEFLVGNVIDPKISGDKLDLSPLVIIVSLLFWGFMWGIAGMFLAVPIMLVIKLVCETIPVLQPAGVVLSSGKRFSRERSRRLTRLSLWIARKIVVLFRKLKRKKRAGHKE